MKTLTFALIGTLLAAAAPAQPANLLTDGRFRVGCNYWASHAAVRMWRDWRPDIVGRDLDDLSTNGVRILRVFPLWSDFQPIVRVAGFANQPSEVAWATGPLPDPSGVDARMVERFRTFCDMADRRGMKLVVGLVTGWMSGRTFVPPLLADKNLMTDPEAVLWEVRYVRRLVSALRDHPAIAAWGLGNECNCLQHPVTRSQAWTWMNAIASAIRLSDPTRPVTSGMHEISSAATASWNIRDQGELLDILTTHPYPIFTPECAREPYDTMRDELHASAESLLYAALSGRPCFVEEAGDLGRGTVSIRRAAASLRCALFSCWANGLGAYLWWCAYDYDDLDFPPYENSAFESDLGLFTPQRRPKETLLELGKFDAFLKTLPFDRLPPRRTDAVVLVSERRDAWRSAFGAFLLSRQAGFDIAFAGSEAATLPSAPLYVMPAGTYTRSAWLRVLARVEAGTTLLLSHGGDERYPHFLERTGCEVDAHVLEPSGGTFAFDADPACRISWHDETTTRILPRTAKTLARTTDGEAIVTVAPFGRGKVVYVNFAIEADSVMRSGCFSGRPVDPRYRVYRAAADVARLTPAVRKGDVPEVGVTAHPAAGGTTICVAVNYAPYAVTCPFEAKGRVGRIFRGEVRGKTLVLPANDAIVFELLP